MTTTAQPAIISRREVLTAALLSSKAQQALSDNADRLDRWSDGRVPKGATVELPLTTLGVIGGGGRIRAAHVKAVAPGSGNLHRVAAHERTYPPR